MESTDNLFDPEDITIYADGSKMEAGIFAIRCSKQKSHSLGLYSLLIYMQ